MKRTPELAPRAGRVSLPKKRDANGFANALNAVLSDADKLSAIAKYSFSLFLHCGLHFVPMEHSSWFRDGFS